MAASEAFSTLRQMLHATPSSSSSSSSSSGNDDDDDNDNDLVVEDVEDNRAFFGKDEDEDEDNDDLPLDFFCFSRFAEEVPVDFFGCFRAVVVATCAICCPAALVNRNSQAPMDRTRASPS